MAIKSYRDKGTYDIARSVPSKEARRALPESLHGVARKRLAFLAAAESIADLKSRRGLGFHDLRSARKGQFAIKINDQYRVCFIWRDTGAELVEIVDYH